MASYIVNAIYSVFVLYTLFNAVKCNWWHLGIKGIDMNQLAPFLTSTPTSQFEQDQSQDESGDQGRAGHSKLLMDEKFLHSYFTDEIIRMRSADDAQLNHRMALLNFCAGIPGLVAQQIKICEHNPFVLQPVSLGAKMAIKECQRQFRNERWNCSTESDKQVFGHTIQRNSRETAFVNAIISAGVVYAIAQACSQGNLTNCSCDNEQGTVKPYLDVRDWRWGGCSDNIRYGISFSKKFVDAPEMADSRNRRSIRAIMNLHNNKVGREAIRSLMKLKCRCHGSADSCELKTCWKTLPKFEEIGKYLKNRYLHSVQITALVNRSENEMSRRKRRNKKVITRMIASSSRAVSPGKQDLVHLHKSPNYCVQDTKNGILGTAGRRCSRSLNGSDNCSFLCCGRGFDKQIHRKLERCHCKFQWCCEVKCKTCEKIIEVYICK